MRLAFELKRSRFASSSRLLIFTLQRQWQYYGSHPQSFLFCDDCRGAKELCGSPNISRYASNDAKSEVPTKLFDTHPLFMSL